jgi:hypothetical protein
MYKTIESRLANFLLSRNEIGVPTICGYSLSKLFIIILLQSVAKVLLIGYRLIGEQLRPVDHTIGFINTDTDLAEITI